MTTILSPVLPEDLAIIAEGTYSAFPTFYDPIEPPSLRPPPLIRISHFATRLLPFLNSPKTHCTKASVDGKLVGVTLWQLSEKGERVRNLKRRMWDEEEGMGDGEQGEWEGVSREGDDGVWGVWDVTREGIMKGLPHYYLAPIWVLPEYQSRGIGKALLEEGLRKADEVGVACYLEATKEGKRMYEKFGFEVEGRGEYTEMVRWGKGGRPE